MEKIEIFIYKLNNQHNMFLKITKKSYNNKIHKQASIVESIRIGGKLKQRLVRNLGTIKTKSDEEKARDFLNK